MDYSEDDDDSKTTKANRSAFSRHLCFLMIGIGMIIFVVGSYYLVLIFKDIAADYPLHLTHSSSGSTPYEQFVEALVSGVGSGEVKYPLVVGEEFRRNVRERLTQRYNYLEQNRPPLLPFPPPKGEVDLPYQNLYSVIEKWNPDIPDVPIDFKETIQHFNYGDPKEKAMAEAYRNAELPFKLYNVSEFNLAAEKWDDHYLITHVKHLSGQSHAEKSKNNHFMFWALRGRSPAAYKPPTEIIKWKPYSEYLQTAKQADAERWNSSMQHFYYMLGVQPHDHRFFVGKDLPSFSDYHNNFFITNTQANKGIQCRFGMRGVIAETHYDSGKNMVAMLHGRKRYILTPPRTCKYLGIISDQKHPSYRHSVIDWSDLSQCKANNFDKVDAIDTIVNMGEVLYIPSFWFHYIVSLEYSIQCNSRSGFPANRIGQREIKECFGE